MESKSKGATSGNHKLETETNKILNSCRVCMSRANNMTSIFCKESTSIVERVLFCTGVHLTEELGLPTHMCNTCLNNLTIAHKFKTSCILSDETFRKIQVSIAIKTEAPETEEHEGISGFDDDNDDDDDKDELMKMLNLTEIKANRLRPKKETCDRYTSPGLPRRPACGHNTKALKCAMLTSNDMLCFHKNFYSKADKIHQDNYIIKNVVVAPVSRRRPRNNTKTNQRHFTVKYNVFSRNTNSYVPVCKNAFISVLRIKASRVEGVTKRFGENMTMAKENRGGNRKASQFASRKEAVQNFVKKLTPLKTHSCKSKIKAPDLNIKKMWRIYNDDALPGCQVKEGYFRKIFNTCFNIGFGSSRQDICSD